MLETILCILAIVEILITIRFVLYIGYKAKEDDENRNNFVLTTLKGFIKKLFVERNCFGIILSSIIFIIIIPAILFLLLSEILMWILCLLITIWNLGNKKEL